jgi:DNA mismatch repair ATPase MutS
VQGSLLHLLDMTKSRAGARLLRLWLSRPLVCLEAITERQDAVADLVATPELLARVQEACAARCACTH